MSTAFIIYFAAGGHIAEPTIRLAVVNVTFNEPQVLAIIAWIMLFWFALRFWQTTGSKYMGAFEQELRSGKVPTGLADHVRTLSFERRKVKALIEQKKDISIDVSSMHRQGEKWFLICHVIANEQGGRSQLREERVEVSGWMLRRHLVRAFITHAFLGNAAADYLVPYLLFIGAVFSPLWSA